MRPRFQLNAWRIQFSPEQFSVRTERYKDSYDLRRRRAELEGEWFLLRKGETVMGLALSKNPKLSFGTSSVEHSASSHEGLQILTARLNQALPAFLPDYAPLRWRKFRFLSRKTEFVSKITKKWEVDPLVTQFSITPRTDLEARVVELTEGKVEAAVVASIGMRWNVEAPLEKLSAIGIPLEGLYVVRRVRVPGEPALVGRIESIENTVVSLAESPGELSQIKCSEVKLEGSKTNFVACLSRLLKTKYRQFEIERERMEAEFLTGPALEKLFERLGKECRKQGSISVGGGISAAFDQRLAYHEQLPAEEPTYQSVRRLGEVQYCYSSDRSEKHRFAWEGLVEHGPFDADTFEFRSPRVLVVHPAQFATVVGRVVHALRDGLRQSPFPIGMQRLFELQNLRFDHCELPDERSSAVQIGPAYKRAIELHLGGRADYTVALVVLDDRYARLPNALNPYLHAKAVLLSNGIPAQEVRLSTLSQDTYSLAHTLRNLSVALYAKMNGIPWTIDHVKSFDHEIVLGIGMAELVETRSLLRQRFVGITTVFQGDGNFLLSNLSKECTYEDYPDALEQTLVDVLREVKERFRWRDGDRIRVVLHSHKQLKDIEIDALISRCLQAVSPDQDIHFASLGIVLDHPFKVFDYHQTGIRVKSDENVKFKGQYVPERGLMVQLGASTRLLSTLGPRLIKRPETPFPTPLLVHLHRRSTSRDLDALTEQVLKFTSLTWRSVQPAEKPVTVYYSELIAELLARLRAIPGWNPATLNTRLRASKWFL
jgi:Piwi domain